MSSHLTFRKGGTNRTLSYKAKKKREKKEEGNEETIDQIE
jgi:hypothetical protein